MKVSLIALGQIPRSGIAESYRKDMFTSDFIKTANLFSGEIKPFSIPRQRVAPHLHQQLALPGSLDFAILVRGSLRWDF